MPGGEHSPMWLRIGGDNEPFTIDLHGSFVEASFSCMLISSICASVKDNAIFGGRDPPPGHISVFKLLLIMSELPLLFLASCMKAGEEYLSNG